MHLKTADDKTPDIDALQALLERRDLDAGTRRRIEREIWAIRLGARAEADAAYQIDFDLKDGRNWAVIHDLRLDIEGQVAQIDHLVISRMLEVFVCESKSFTGGVKVNEHGEWTTFHDRVPVGIPSPVEQNRRHIVVLARAIKLGYVELPRRVVAIRPTFHNRVLVSAKSSIGRPRRPLPELDHVLKVDQFRTHLLARDFSGLSMLKIVGSETLEAFGRQLVALHQPQRMDWASRFGLPATAQVPPAAPAPASSTVVLPPVVPPRPAVDRPAPKPSGLPCTSCGIELSTAEAYFCRVNKARFDGRIYCIPCQQRVPRSVRA